MIGLFLTQLALAGTASDDLVHMVVDEIYGKDVPDQAVCIERPELPEPFAADIVAIGVMRGAVGCELMGVMVNSAFKKPEVAAAAAIDDGAWKKASASEKATWMLQWTNSVQLAFKQFDVSGAMPSSKPIGSSTAVTVTYWERTEDDYVARHATGVYTWDSKGELSDLSVEGPRYRYSFGANAYRLNGQNGDAIHGALTQQGKTLKNCAKDAWKKDLTFHGSTRMQFQISGTKASQIALVAEDDSGTGVERCYSAALKKITFPDSVDGTVVWSFVHTRKLLAD